MEKIESLFGLRYAASQLAVDTFPVLIQPGYFFL